MSAKQQLTMFRTSEIQNLEDTALFVFHALQQGVRELSQEPLHDLAEDPKRVLEGIRVLLAEVAKRKRSGVVWFLDTPEGQSSSEIVGPDEVCYCGLSIRQAAVQILDHVIYEHAERRMTKSYFPEISGQAEFEFDLFFSRAQSERMSGEVKEYITKLHKSCNDGCFSEFLKVLVLFEDWKLDLFRPGPDENFSVDQLEDMRKLEEEQFKLLDGDYSAGTLKTASEL